MNTLNDILENSAGIILLIAIIVPIIKWTILYAIFKAAIRNAIVEAHDIINNNTHKITPEEAFQKEMEGWS